MTEQPPKIVLINDDDSTDLTLLDLVDHLLNTGIIIRGNLVLSLAGVDLVYLGLDLVVTSVETALRHMTNAALPPRPHDPTTAPRTNAPRTNTRTRR
jgi:gas vesicle structural protein